MRMNEKPKGGPKVDLKKTSEDSAKPRGEPRVDSRELLDKREALLSRLLTLSPMPDDHQLIKRMSPAQWQEAREALLQSLLPDPYLEKLLLERPNLYFPKWLESYRNSRNELDRIVSEKTTAEAEGKEYRYGQEFTK